MLIIYLLYLRRRKENNGCSFQIWMEENRKLFWSTKNGGILCTTSKSEKVSQDSHMIWKIKNEKKWGEIHDLWRSFGKKWGDFQKFSKIFPKVEVHLCNKHIHVTLMLPIFFTYATIICINKTKNKRET